MREELAWAAGFSDGEGGFTACPNGNYKTPRFQVYQKDRELLDRMRAVLGFGRVNYKTGEKACHVFQLGAFELVQMAAILLWPWFGSVRRAQIKRTLLAMRRRRYEMAKLTDKDRVLRFMQKLDGETRTTKVSKATGIPHPSARRILNELRAEGHVNRGGTHGSWLSVVQEILTDEPIVPGSRPVPVDVVEDINLRDDVPEPEINIYKLECQGDTVYAFDETEVGAFAQLNAAFSPGSDPIPRNLVVITKVEAVPEDGDVLAADSLEPLGEVVAAEGEDAALDGDIAIEDDGQ